MSIKHKIALSIPDPELSGKHFSLRLKDRIENEPSRFEKVSKILAISDIEGNFNRFMKFLLINRVIDKNIRWTFGDGHLVIVGDCFDRGEQVVECLWLIYSLEERAKREGGYVHFILGNHEIMNLNGDWRYIHPKYAKTSVTPFTAYYNGNQEIWHWITTKNIIEIIGDYLFVHGGISEQLLQLKLSVEEINARVRPFYARSNEDFTDPLLNIVFKSHDSPFWYRGYYYEQENILLLKATLAQYNVKNIITGHTQMGSITSIFRRRLINIDTNHALETSESLLIEDGRFFKVKSNGEKIKISK